MNGSAGDVAVGSWAGTRGERLGGGSGGRRQRVRFVAAVHVTGKYKERIRRTHVGAKVD